MVDTSNTCSTSKSVNERPLVVRVKRKASLSPVEAFWLEINERPSKRLLLDLGKLSLSDTRDKEELKNKKVFVQRIETVSSSDATKDILQSYVPNSAKSSEIRTKVAERKRLFKDGNKKDQLLSKSKQRHEFLAKNARFEQVQKRRFGKDTVDGDLHKMCHLYDVVRLDSNEDHSNKKEEPKDTSLEDSLLLSNYLPLLREFLPKVAEEIHSDMQAYFNQHHSPQQVPAGPADDDYVYDLYTVQDEMEATNEDPQDAYPLVQVNEEDDFYDGPMQSEFESDDSNAEDNPLNEYPDEETSEEEEEEEEEDEDSSKASCEESEEESESSSYQSEKVQDKRHDVEDEDLLYADQEDSGDDDFDYDYDRLETQMTV